MIWSNASNLMMPSIYLFYFNVQTSIVHNDFFYTSHIELFVQLLDKCSLIYVSVCLFKITYFVVERLATYVH